MLEQYVQRIVAAYLEDYVTNFDKSELNLSFWHGKATLTNLNLNTAVLHASLDLPPCLKIAHGRVGRLIIEIPWTRIGSDPVVVTLEDVQCTLASVDADAALTIMLQDTPSPLGGGASGSGTPAASGASSPRGGRRRAAVGSPKPASSSPSSPARDSAPSTQQPAAEAAPGYLQNLLNTVVANTVVRINGLTLHVGMDPAVLRLHAASAEIRTAANATTWAPGMCQVNAQQFAMHKCVDVKGITLHLDETQPGPYPTIAYPAIASGVDVRVRARLTFTDGFHGGPSLVQADVLISDVVVTMCDQQVKALAEAAAEVLEAMRKTQQAAQQMDDEAEVHTQREQHHDRGRHSDESSSSTGVGEALGRSAASKRGGSISSTSQKAQDGSFSMAPPATDWQASTSSSPVASSGWWWGMWPWGEAEADEASNGQGEKASSGGQHYTSAGAAIAPGPSSHDLAGLGSAAAFSGDDVTSHLPQQGVETPAPRATSYHKQHSTMFQGGLHVGRLDLTITSLQQVLRDPFLAYCRVHTRPLVSLHVKGAGVSAFASPNQHLHFSAGLNKLCLSFPQAPSFRGAGTTPRSSGTSDDSRGPAGSRARVNSGDADGGGNDTAAGVGRGGGDAAGSDGCEHEAGTAQPYAVLCRPASAHGLAEAGSDGDDQAGEDMDPSAYLRDTLFFQQRTSATPTQRSASERFSALSLQVSLETSESFSTQSASDKARTASTDDKSRTSTVTPTQVDATCTVGTCEVHVDRHIMRQVARLRDTASAVFTHVRPHLPSTSTLLLRTVSSHGWTEVGSNGAPGNDEAGQRAGDLAAGHKEHAGGDARSSGTAPSCAHAASSGNRPVGEGGDDEGQLHQPPLLSIRRLCAVKAKGTLCRLTISCTTDLLIAPEQQQQQQQPPPRSRLPLRSVGVNMEGLRALASLKADPSLSSETARAARSGEAPVTGSSEAEGGHHGGGASRRRDQRDEGTTTGFLQLDCKRLRAGAVALHRRVIADTLCSARQLRLEGRAEVPRRFAALPRLLLDGSITHTSAACQADVTLAQGTLYLARLLASLPRLPSLPSSTPTLPEEFDLDLTASDFCLEVVLTPSALAMRCGVVELMAVRETFSTASQPPKQGVLFSMPPLPYQAQESSPPSSTTASFTTHQPPSASATQSTALMVTLETPLIESEATSDPLARAKHATPPVSDARLFQPHVFTMTTSTYVGFLDGETVDALTTLVYRLTALKNLLKEEGGAPTSTATATNKRTSRPYAPPVTRREPESKHEREGATGRSQWLPAAHLERIIVQADVASGMCVVGHEAPPQTRPALSAFLQMMSKRSGAGSAGDGDGERGSQHTMLDRHLIVRVPSLQLRPSASTPNVTSMTELPLLLEVSQSTLPWGMRVGPCHVRLHTRPVSAPATASDGAISTLVHLSETKVDIRKCHPKQGQERQEQQLDCAVQLGEVRIVADVEAVETALQCVESVLLRDIFLMLPGALATGSRQHRHKQRSPEPQPSPSPPCSSSSSPGLSSKLLSPPHVGMLRTIRLNVSTIHMSFCSSSSSSASDDVSQHPHHHHHHHHRQRQRERLDLKLQRMACDIQVARSRAARAVRSDGCVTGGHSHASFRLGDVCLQASGGEEDCYGTTPLLRTAPTAAMAVAEIAETGFSGHSPNYGDETGSAFLHATFSPPGTFHMRTGKATGVLWLPACIHAVHMCHRLANTAVNAVERAHAFSTLMAEDTDDAHASWHTAPTDDSTDDSTAVTSPCVDVVLGELALLVPDSTHASTLNSSSSSSSSSSSNDPSSTPTQNGDDELPSCIALVLGRTSLVTYMLESADNDTPHADAQPPRAQPQAESGAQVPAGDSSLDASFSLGPNSLFDASTCVQLELSGIGMHSLQHQRRQPQGTAPAGEGSTEAAAAATAAPPPPLSWLYVYMHQDVLAKRAPIVSNLDFTFNLRPKPELAASTDGSNSKTSPQASTPVSSRLPAQQQHEDVEGHGPNVPGTETLSHELLVEAPCEIVAFISNDQAALLVEIAKTNVMPLLLSLAQLRWHAPPVPSSPERGEPSHTEAEDVGPRHTMFRDNATRAREGTSEMRGSDKVSGSVQPRVDRRSAVWSPQPVRMPTGSVRRPRQRGHMRSQSLGTSFMADTRGPGSERKSFAEAGRSGAASPARYSARGSPQPLPTRQGLRRQLQQRQQQEGALTDNHDQFDPQHERQQRQHPRSVSHGGRQSRHRRTASASSVVSFTCAASSVLFGPQAPPLKFDMAMALTRVSLIFYKAAAAAAAAPPPPPPQVEAREHGASTPSGMAAAQQSATSQLAASQTSVSPPHTSLTSEALREMEALVGRAVPLLRVCATGVTLRARASGARTTYSADLGRASIATQRSRVFRTCVRLAAELQRDSHWDEGLVVIASEADTEADTIGASNKGPTASAAGAEAQRARTSATAPALGLVITTPAVGVADVDLQVPGRVLVHVPQSFVHFALEGLCSHATYLKGLLQLVADTSPLATPREGVVNAAAAGQTASVGHHAGTKDGSAGRGDGGSSGDGDGWDGARSRSASVDTGVKGSAELHRLLPSVKLRLSHCVLRVSSTVDASAVASEPRDQPGVEGRSVTRRRLHEWWMQCDMRAVDLTLASQPQASGSLLPAVTASACGFSIVGGSNRLPAPLCLMPPSGVLKIHATMNDVHAFPAEPSRHAVSVDASKFQLMLQPELLALMAHVKEGTVEVHRLLHRTRTMFALKTSLTKSSGARRRSMEETPLADETQFDLQMGRLASTDIVTPVAAFDMDTLEPGTMLSTPDSLFWRYPQPRRVSRILLRPTPHLTTSMAEEQEGRQCVLSCWDEVDSEFVVVRVLNLGVDQEVELLLSLSSPAGHTWKLSWQGGAREGEDTSQLLASVWLSSAPCPELQCPLHISLNLHKSVATVLSPRAHANRPSYNAPAVLPALNPAAAFPLLCLHLDALSGNAALPLTTTNANANSNANTTTSTNASTTTSRASMRVTLRLSQPPVGVLASSIHSGPPGAAPPILARVDMSARGSFTRHGAEQGLAKQQRSNAQIQAEGEGLHDAGGLLGQLPDAGTRPQPRPALRANVTAPVVELAATPRVVRTLQHLFADASHMLQVEQLDYPKQQQVLLRYCTRVLHNATNRDLWLTRASPSASAGRKKASALPVFHVPAGSSFPLDAVTNKAAFAVSIVHPDDAAAHHWTEAVASATALTRLSLAAGPGNAPALVAELQPAVAINADACGKLWRLVGHCRVSSTVSAPVRLVVDTAAPSTQGGNVRFQLQHELSLQADTHHMSLLLPENAVVVGVGAFFGTREHGATAHHPTPVDIDNVYQQQILALAPAAATAARCSITRFAPAAVGTEGIQIHLSPILRVVNNTDVLLAISPERKLTSHASNSPFRHTIDQGSQCLCGPHRPTALLQPWLSALTGDGVSARAVVSVLQMSPQQHLIPLCEVGPKHTTATWRYVPVPHLGRVLVLGFLGHEHSDGQHDATPTLVIGEGISVINFTDRSLTLTLCGLQNDATHEAALRCHLPAWDAQAQDGSPLIRFDADGDGWTGSSLILPDMQGNERTFIVLRVTMGQTVAEGQTVLAGEAEISLTESETWNTVALFPNPGNKEVLPAPARLRLRLETHRVGRCICVRVWPTGRFDNQTTKALAVRMNDAQHALSPVIVRPQTSIWSYAAAPVFRLTSGPVFPTHVQSRVKDATSAGIRTRTEDQAFTLRACTHDIDRVTTNISTPSISTGPGHHYQHASTTVGSDDACASALPVRASVQRGSGDMPVLVRLAPTQDFLVHVTNALELAAWVCLSPPPAVTAHLQSLKNWMLQEQARDGERPCDAPSPWFFSSPHTAPLHLAQLLDPSCGVPLSPSSSSTGPSKAKSFLIIVTTRTQAVDTKYLLAPLGSCGRTTIPYHGRLFSKSERGQLLQQRQQQQQQQQQQQVHTSQSTRADSKRTVDIGAAEASASAAERAKAAPAASTPPAPAPPPPPAAAALAAREQAKDETGAAKSVSSRRSRGAYAVPEDDDGGVCVRHYLRGSCRVVVLTAWETANHPVSTHERFTPDTSAAPAPTIPMEMSVHMHVQRLHLALVGEATRIGPLTPTPKGAVRGGKAAQRVLPIRSVHLTLEDARLSVEHLPSANPYVLCARLVPVVAQARSLRIHTPAHPTLEFTNVLEFSSSVPLGTDAGAGGSLCLRVVLMDGLPINTLRSVAVGFGSVRAHVEDAFLYAVLELGHSFVSAIHSTDSNSSSGDESSRSTASTAASATTVTATTPTTTTVSTDSSINNNLSADTVLSAAPPMLAPVPGSVCNQQLHVDAVRVEATVHASAFLFLSLDGAVLRLSRLDAEMVGHHNSRVLADAVARHLQRQAVAQAGWVVGSLGLLGSPATALRRVGGAVGDVLEAAFGAAPSSRSIPMTRAATAAGGNRVQRIAAASGRLVAQAATSLLGSVETAARSVGRNVSRMTMDEHHQRLGLQRRAARHQHQDEGQEQGSFGSHMLHGAQGLGMGLLAGMAGLVDQPLRASVSDQASVSGVLAGFGRGMVGLVTKPLEGTLDFVESTTRGVASLLPAHTEQGRHSRLQTGSARETTARTECMAMEMMCESLWAHMLASPWLTAATQQLPPSHVTVYGRMGSVVLWWGNAGDVVVTGEMRERGEGDEEEVQPHELFAAIVQPQQVTESSLASRAAPQRVFQTRLKVHNVNPEWVSLEDVQVPARGYLVLVRDYAGPAKTAYVWLSIDATMSIYLGEVDGDAEMLLHTLPQHQCAV